MTNQINSRIVTLGIQVLNPSATAAGPNAPDFMLFEGLDIQAQGQKFAGVQSDTCTVKISNLTRAQKNWLLTIASPLTTAQQPGRKPVLVTLSVGRENDFPPFLLFQGYCWASHVTMPPDIGIVLTSTTNNYQASALQPQNFGALTTVAIIAAQIAAQYHKTLNIKPGDGVKQVANFQYTGGLQAALNKLARVSGMRVQCSHDVLSLYNIGETVNGAQSFSLNTSTGMVGIPEVTESGVKAMCLIRPEPKIGGPIKIQSSVNPSINNQPFFISTLNYHVTNRDDPFWYELFCTTTTGLQQTQ